MPQRILITGITGFLGSHIAENLVNNGLQVLGLKRKDSNIWRCEGFKEKIIWVDIDEYGLFEEKLEKYSFESIIHAAWIGVGSKSRNDWNEQSKNITFLLSLLTVAKTVGVEKFVFLGSQAEYGYIEEKISESHTTNPSDAYGSVKLACLEIVKSFCRMNDINWVWLRLFSLFGTKENRNWLIPSLISSMLASERIKLTPGEQKYAYLFVEDFCVIVTKILIMTVQSGVYNISSNETRTIKSLVEDIRNRVNPDFVLNFGNVNYTEGQSMHIEGDISKIATQIGEIQLTDFSIALASTINYYIKNRNDEGCRFYS